MLFRSNEASSFGARFDMETDALLILVLAALVWQHGKAGPWILAAGLMRYAFVDTDEFAKASPRESGGVERLKSLRRKGSGKVVAAR